MTTGSVAVVATRGVEQTRGPDVESLEYVRSRRWWWVIVVPLIAALAAAAWTWRSERLWTATATVDPVLTGATAGLTGQAFDGDEYVAAFQTLATGAAMRAEVADATGVPASRLDSLEVEQSGNSTGLTVRFASYDRRDVEPVLEAVTRLTLERVFTTGSQQADDAVARAQEQVAAADAALTQFGTRTGVADAGRAYQSLLTQLNSLESRRADAQASGDGDRAAELATEVTAARQALEGYVPLLAEYDALRAERDAAQGRLDDARERQDQAVEQATAAEPAQVVFVAEPRQEDLMAALVPAAGVAGGVALVLCLLLASLRETGSRRRAPSPRVRGASATEPSATTSA